MYQKIAVALGLAVASTGCAGGTYQEYKSESKLKPLVMISTGPVTGDTLWSQGYYVVDTQTHTCWLYWGHSPQRLECCALRSIEAAKPYLTWQEEDTCNEQG